MSITQCQYDKCVPGDQSERTQATTVVGIHTCESKHLLLGTGCCSIVQCLPSKDDVFRLAFGVMCTLGWEHLICSLS